MPLNFQDRMPLRLSRILIVALVVVSAVTITIYAAEGEDGFLHSVQSKVRSLVLPLGEVGSGVGAAVESAEESMSDAAAGEGTLSELRSRNAELTETLVKAEEYRLEAQRLQELLNLKDQYGVEGVAGRVVGRSTDAWSQTITLDVGLDDGVDAGLTVVAGSGVIGQVVSTASGSCTVRLITDPQSGVAAMIQSSRAEGIVRGSLSGLLYLEGVEMGIEVSVGDVVMTSGLGGSFTKGLLIGTVVRVEGDATDDSRRIVVSQAGNVSSLEEAMVVFSAKESSSSGASSSSSDSSSADATADGVGSSASDGSSADDAPSEGETE